MTDYFRLPPTLIKLFKLFNDVKYEDMGSLWYIFYFTKKLVRSKKRRKPREMYLDRHPNKKFFTDEEILSKT